ncbi:MAG: DNA alkylation repair protein [Fibrobacteraceae bacterium]|nr:DNA alkylation repair protein [Fibrobacteraceae bacterium]
MPTIIQKRLLALQDSKYKAFQCKLTPTINPKTVIGIRTPILRKFGKEIAGTADAEKFLRTLPHKYYDENNLHGFLIQAEKDYDRAVSLADAFLPYVDNWATCDLMSPKVFKKHLPELLVQIKKWLRSGKTYTVRFGVEMLMSFFLDAEFKKEYLELVAKIRSDEYYVKMMVAWFFATALAKQYEATIPYIQAHRLAPWTHNKTIQKAVESYRITDAQKAYLRTLKD